MQIGLGARAPLIDQATRDVTVEPIRHRRRMRFIARDQIRQAPSCCKSNFKNRSSTSPR